VVVAGVPAADTLELVGDVKHLLSSLFQHHLTTLLLLLLMLLPL